MFHYTMRIDRWRRAWRRRRSRPISLVIRSWLGSPRGREFQPAKVVLLVVDRIECEWAAVDQYTNEERTNLPFTTSIEMVERRRRGSRIFCAWPGIIGRPLHLCAWTLCTQISTRLPPQCWDSCSVHFMNLLRFGWWWICDHYHGLANVQSDFDLLTLRDVQIVIISLPCIYPVWTCIYCWPRHKLRPCLQSTVLSLSPIVTTCWNYIRILVIISGAGRVQQARSLAARDRNTPNAGPGNQGKHVDTR